MMRRLILNRTGSGAAEFSLVLPLLILLLFGMIDTGRYMWEYNRAEKATMMGARMAVVTDSISGGLAAANYVGTGSPALTQGDPIPAAALGTVVCTSTGCCNPTSLCTTPYPAVGTYGTIPFNAIVRRMQYMYPAITADKVRVEYRGSGLGYAGDPNGMEVAPLITVRLVGQQFRPLSFLMLTHTNMPDFATTLTSEDSSGTTSN